MPLLLVFGNPLVVVWELMAPLPPLTTAWAQAPPLLLAPALLVVWRRRHPLPSEEL